MSERKCVPVIGLVGGVGSGKSAVSAWLHDSLGFAVIDADTIGHHVLTIAEVKNKLRDRFGDSIFDEEGSIDRTALGRIVFGTSSQQRVARADLEQIVHPRIEQEIERQVQEIRTTDASTGILLDAAILLEAGWNQLCDLVVFVDVPFRQRLERVQTGRNWDEKKLKARESSQLSTDLKRRQSDFVVDNSGSVAAAGAQLEQYLKSLDDTQK